MRVSVVIQRPEQALGLSRWGFRFARALEAELTLLWCPKTHEQTRRFDAEEGLEDCPRRAVALVEKLQEPWGDWHDVTHATGQVHLRRSPDGETEVIEPPPPLPDPRITVVCPGGSDSAEAVLRELGRDMPEILLAAAPESKGRHSLARRLFAQAPCRTLLLRQGTAEAERCRGLLVASAGGPSARSALRLGHKLAIAEGAPLEALFLHSDVDQGEQVGHAVLEKVLEGAGLEDKENVVRRVLLGDDLSQAIEETVADRLDLVLLGASHIGVVRGLLFGTVPERLLSRPGGCTVGVMREKWSPGDRFRARLGRWLDLRIPQLEREQRVELYRHLESGSAWSFDFMLLIALSTSIAALGLIQNSAAVVIGAMLVAPLMTPILGFGLALLQGNVHLLSAATRALVSGYGLALLLGFVCGVIAGPESPTPELLARGGPTLLDMAVALLSGVAAAYCLGRPGLLAALPGVAIAAALVPPIATSGIALANGELALAKGASILFGTNVAAIILGAVISLFAVGVRAGAQPKPAQRRARLLIGALLALLAVLAIPLTKGWQDARASGPPAESVLRQLRAEARGAGVELSEVDCSKKLNRCQITVATSVPLEPAEARKLAIGLQGHLEGRPRVRLLTEISTFAP